MRPQLQPRPALRTEARGAGKACERRCFHARSAAATHYRRSPTNREDLERNVAAHPFLLGLSEHHIRLIADCAIRTHFEKDQVIFRERETANRFYLIEQGKVTLESSGSGGDPVNIDMVGDGDLLGWSWLFPPYIWHFTARATEPTTAIFFYGTVLREYCEQDQALGYELFKRMSEVMTRRLQGARVRLLNAYAAHPSLVPPNARS